MQRNINFIIVGKDAVVEYEVGEETKTVSGEVKDVDDRGYLVLKDANGKIILIPKDRIVTVKEK
jgi:hypothetical protein